MCPTNKKITIADQIDFLSKEEVLYNGHNINQSIIENLIVLRDMDKFKDLNQLNGCDHIKDCQYPGCECGIDNNDIDEFRNQCQQMAEIAHELHHSRSVMNRFIESASASEVLLAANCMIQCLKSGGKIISCGNGGSFSDAQHFASELSGKYRSERPAIAAMALTDGGVMSCVGNDYGYESVFARQVNALGKKGDVLLCLSTSGNSENVYQAQLVAKSKGIKTISITGDSMGKILLDADISIVVPHHGTADRIQEVTIVIIHILVKLIEKGLGYVK